MNQTKLNQHSPDCYSYESDQTSSQQSPDCYTCSYESDQTSSTVNRIRPNIINSHQTVITMNQTKLHLNRHQTAIAMNQIKLHQQSLDWYSYESDQTSSTVNRLL
jgi:hypothetical protein